MRPPFHSNNQSKEDDLATGYESDSTDSNITQAASVAEGVITQVLGDINRRQRIGEDKQWQEVISAMFSVFMICRDRCGTPKVR